MAMAKAMAKAMLSSWASSLEATMKCVYKVSVRSTPYLQDEIRPRISAEGNLNVRYGVLGTPYPPVTYVRTEVPGR